MFFFSMLEQSFARVLIMSGGLHVRGRTRGRGQRRVRTAPLPANPPPPPPLPALDGFLIQLVFCKHLLTSPVGYAIP